MNCLKYLFSSIVIIILVLVKTPTSAMSNGEGVLQNPPIIENTAIIIDLGMTTTRAGLANANAPQITLPTGDAVQLNNVINWSSWEQLIQQVFDDLNVTSSDHPVLLLDAPMNLKANRESMVDKLLNTFNVPKVHIASSVGAVFLLSEKGENGTGLITHCEDEVCYVVPYVGSAAIPHAIIVMSETLSTQDELFNRGESINNTPGLHEVCYNSIMKADVDMRQHLYANIYLSGENSQYDDTQIVLKTELAALAPPTMTINVNATSNRENLPFEGGKFMVPILDSFNMWLTSATYTPSLLHQTCEF